MFLLCHRRHKKISFCQTHAHDRYAFLVRHMKHKNSFIVIITLLKMTISQCLSDYHSKF